MFLKGNTHLPYEAGLFQIIVNISPSDLQNRQQLRINLEGIYIYIYHIECQIHPSQLIKKVSFNPPRNMFSLHFFFPI